MPFALGVNIVNSLRPGMGFEHACIVTWRRRNPEIPCRAKEPVLFYAWARPNTHCDFQGREPCTCGVGRSMQTFFERQISQFLTNSAN